jgi:hypothetical protein
MEAESWEEVELQTGNTTTVTARSEKTSTETTVQRDSEAKNRETTSDRDTADVYA